MSRLFLRGRGALAAAAIAATAALLVSCSPTPASVSSTTAESGTPVEGGTLRLSISAEPGCLDSHSISATQQALLGRLIYDNLVTLDRDGNLAPYLAESWDISEDGKTYVFHLREDVTFSDGSPWNAEVLGQNFEHMRDPATKSPLAAAYIAPYVDGTVIDEHTFEAHLEYAYTPFLYGLAQSWVAITSGKAIEESPEALCQNPIGSGPFVVDEYNPGQSISYVKRAGYHWAPEWLGYEGEAHLDRVDITVVPEEVIRYESLVSGQYDITEALPPQNAAAIQANSDFVYENLVRTGSPNVLHFNTSRAPFDDIVVRKAFVAAVNREAIAGALGFNTYDVKDNYLSSETVYYDKSTEGTLVYDPDAANELLDGAGWIERDGDGYRLKDGQRLTVVVPTTQSATPSPLLVQLQGEVKKVGIELIIDQVPQAQLSDRRYAGDYDALTGVWHTNTPDILFIRYHSSEITGERIGQNSSYLNDPELDGLLQATREASDGADAEAAYSAAQHRLLDLVPGLPLYENHSQWAYSTAVQGIEIDTSHPIPVFTNAWIED